MAVDLIILVHLWTQGRKTSPRKRRSRLRDYLSDIQKSRQETGGKLYVKKNKNRNLLLH